MLICIVCAANIGDSGSARVSEAHDNLAFDKTTFDPASKGILFQGTQCKISCTFDYFKIRRIVIKTQALKIKSFLFSPGATVGNRYVNESLKLDFIDTLSNADDGNSTNHNRANNDIDISLADGKAELAKYMSEVHKTGSYSKQSR